MNNSNLSDNLTGKELISNQCWPKGNKPKVTIICHTYNHENYIKDAFNSFLSQETDFPIEIIVHDDASSDKTKDIIREYVDKYPHLFKPTYKEKNNFSQNIKPIINMLLRSKGDYIALCDGDDFWTSNNKLQLQFETLEKNSDHIFCGHLTKNFTDIKVNKLEFYSIEHVIKQQFICHTSSFFFKNVFKKLNKASLPEYLFYGFNGDYALTIFLMQNSSCIILPYKMSYYRKNDKGLYQSLKDNEGLIKKAQSMLHVRHQMKYYLGPNEYLNISKKNFINILSIIKRNIMSFNLFGLVKSIGVFGLLLMEYISSSILLHLQKKYKKKTD